MSAYRILFDSSLSHADAPSLSTIEAQQGVTGRRDAPPVVSAVRHEPLTDETREEAIQLAGRLFLKHWARWEETGDFAAKGDADRALRLQNLLIAGRSAAQVAKMESERGLT